MAFLFDGSSYIGQGNFNRTLLFAKSVLAFYHVSEDQTNVAAAVYASSAIVTFNFTEHYNSSEVYVAIENTPFLDEKALNIGNALAVVKTRVFETDRENVPDVLVVFVSDTLTNNFTEIVSELRQQEVTIIVVGVGDKLRATQLKDIASKPESDYVFIFSFQHLDTMEGAVSGAISQGT